MILTVDIGNSHSVFGIWDNHSFIDSARLSTDSARTGYEWYSLLIVWLEKTLNNGCGIDATVVSNVVPAVDDNIFEALEKLGIQKILKVSLDLKFPFQINPEKFPTIGADRLVNAAGAVKYFGENLIIVDLGTAITFCLILNGVYMGGVIAPGIYTSIDALAKKAARLFEISYKKKKTILSQSTRDSLESGIYFGWKGLIKEIITQLKKEAPPESANKITVVATGGVAADLGYSHDVFDIVDPNLTLRGLREIFTINHV
jgi:type III pantothenate kinase